MDPEDTQLKVSDVDSKEYIDRAVQTDTPAPAAQPPSPEHSTSMIFRALSDKLSDMDISATSNGSLSSSQVESSSFVFNSSAYSQDSSLFLSSPPPTIKTTMRKLKRNEVISGRSTRMVSLPETVSAFSAKKALEKTPRIVSNPEGFNFKRVLSTEGSYAEDTLETEPPSRVHVRTIATDTPHTPSPPSSPDSIEIIANNTGLPDNFLRGNARGESPLSSEPDDDGWISWAKSPPRPIPALHGPLSLPYARCPSGAEGTIIEEQGDLPRMIWGLEGDEAAQRSKPEPEHTVTQSYKPVPPQPQLSAPISTPSPSSRSIPRQQVSIPPRFTNRKSQEVSLAPPTSYGSYEHIGITPTTLLPRGMKTHDEYSLPEHGPIDLTNLRPRPDAMYKYQLDSDQPANTAYRTLEDNYRIYNSPDQVDLGWQSLLLTQERLKNLTLSSNVLSPDSLRSSRSSTSLASLASSRSPIILDPPSHLSQSSSWSTMHEQMQVPPSQNTPRRMSALEIAQSYRQQQLMQDRRKQDVLPTPPSSTSPLWSSGFSPYQESLLSPEIIAASRLPAGLSNKASGLQRQRNNVMLQHELPQADHLYEYDYHGHPTVDSRKKMDRNYQPHVVNVQDSPQYWHTQPGNDLAFLAATNRLRQAQGRASVHNLGPLRSPAPPPKAPPNTPSTRDTRHALSQLKSSNVVTPLSPTSPRTLQNGPQQHPRSIPLTKLIQRRLSAVPEEDSVVLSDRAVSPPLRELPNELPIDQGHDSALPPGYPSKMTQAKDVKTSKEGLRQRTDPGEVKSTRGGRVRGRGGRTKRGRAPLSNVVNGPERMNGSMTVHS